MAVGVGVGVELVDEQQPVDDVDRGAGAADGRADVGRGWGADRDARAGTARSALAGPPAEAGSCQGWPAVGAGVTGARDGATGRPAAARRISHAVGTAHSARPATPSGGRPAGRRRSWRPGRSWRPRCEPPTHRWRTTGWTTPRL